MATKINDSFVVNAGAGFSYLARIKGHSGSDVTQASLSSISRTITEYNQDGSIAATTTDSLVISTAIYDTLQTNTALWDQSFNMKDDVAATKVTNRRRHTLQYTFTPASGAVFKSREVDIEGD